MENILFFNCGTVVELNPLDKISLLKNSPLTIFSKICYLITFADRKKYIDHRLHVGVIMDLMGIITTLYRSCRYENTKQT